MPIREEPVMDFFKMILFVEEKYQIRTSDYADAVGTGIKIIEQYNEMMPRELQINRDTDWSYTAEAWKQFAKWREEQQVPALESLPHLNYWHWLLKHPFSDVYNGERRYWSLREILEDEETPDWVKEITQKVSDEFTEYLDDQGGLEVRVSW